MCRSPREPCSRNERYHPPHPPTPLKVTWHDVCAEVQENLAVAMNVTIPPTPPTPPTPPPTQHPPNGHEVRNIVCFGKPLRLSQHVADRTLRSQSGPSHQANQAPISQIRHSSSSGFATSTVLGVAAAGAVAAATGGAARGRKTVTVAAASNKISITTIIFP